MTKKLLLSFSAIALLGLIALTGALPAKAVDTTAPSAPANLAFGTKTYTSISLSWSAATDAQSGISGYIIYRDNIKIADVAPILTYTNVNVKTNSYHTYKVTAVNGAGLESAFSNQITGTTSWDGTAPTVPTNLAGVGMSQTQINLTWSASTDAVGMGGYNIYQGTTRVATTTATSYSHTNLTPATIYTYSVSAFDAAGNTSVKTSAITVKTQADTTKPAISITAPAAGQELKGTVTLTASASDNIGVASMQFMVDGTNASPAIAAAPYTYSLNTALYSDGAHSISAKATDASGNTGVSTAVSITIKNAPAADTQPPQITVDSPSDGATVSGNHISLDGYITDNVAVSSVVMKVDGTAIYSGPWPLAPTYMTYWDSTTVANGQHQITIAATDAAQNTATKNITVNVQNQAAAADAQAPQIFFDSPIDNGTVSGTLTIDASITDSSAISSVLIKVDSTVVASGPYAHANVGSYDVRWDSATVANGQHQISVVATDAAQNTATKTITVTVQNQAAAGNSVPVLVSSTVSPITSTAANIIWTTQNPATCETQTGPTIAYGRTLSENSLYSLEHSYPVYGLSAATLYYYKISCKTAGGNWTVLKTGDFTTAAAAANQVPAGLSIQLVPNKTSGSGPLEISLTVNAVTLDRQTIIKLYYYCNRNEAGSEVAAGYEKLASIRDGTNTYTYAGVCSYRDPGVYILKVVATQGALSAEARVPIAVLNANGQMPPIAGNPNQPSAPIGAHPNGTLVLDGQTVYLIKNGLRTAFRNSEEYRSHGFNFNQVVVASAEDRALPADTDIIKALEGTLVLDASDNRTVFMIGTGNTKRGFTTPAVFKGLGYVFKDLLKINLSDYAVGLPIESATAAHPDGALVLDGQTVWWIRGNTRQGFESAAVFNTYGFSFSKVVPANSADLTIPEGPLVKFRDGTIVKDGNTYYLISDGKKLRFVSTDVLTNKGYKTSNAIIAGLQNYVSGQDLQ